MASPDRVPPGARAWWRGDGEISLARPGSTVSRTSTVSRARDELPPIFLDTDLSDRRQIMVKSSMSRIMRSDVVDAPVGSEGGRRPSTLSTGHNGAGGAASGPLIPGQRWSVNRKREAVLRLLRGEAAEDLSRELGVQTHKLEHWRQKAEAALDGALKERETDAVSGELATAMQRIGELSMEVELLRSRVERPGPLARRRSR